MIGKYLGLATPAPSLRPLRKIFRLCDPAASRLPRPCGRCSLSHCAGSFLGFRLNLATGAAHRNRLIDSPLVGSVLFAASLVAEHPMRTIITAACLFLLASASAQQCKPRTSAVSSGK